MAPCMALGPQGTLRIWLGLICPGFLLRHLNSSPPSGNWGREDIAAFWGHAFALRLTVPDLSEISTNHGSQGLALMSGSLLSLSEAAIAHRLERYGLHLITGPPKAVICVESFLFSEAEHLCLQLLKGGGRKGWKEGVVEGAGDTRERCFSEHAISCPIRAHTVEKELSVRPPQVITQT